MVNEASVSESVILVLPRQESCMNIVPYSFDRIRITF
jgi:hypothetical protein